MAATTGFLAASSRSKPACALRDSASASAALFAAWIISMLAPAMKPSFLPLARTMAFTATSASSERTSSESSAPTSCDRVFTGSPGTSRRQRATPPSISTRKLRTICSAGIMVVPPGSG